MSFIIIATRIILIVSAILIMYGTVDLGIKNSLFDKDAIDNFKAASSDIQKWDACLYTSLVAAGISIFWNFGAFCGMKSVST